MKKTLTLLCCALVILTNGCAFGQATVWTHSWKATIKVVDENGQPVAAAAVAVWYYVKPPADQTEASEKIEGLTDTNGIFRASHASTGSISLAFQVGKAGYYSTTKGHEFSTFGDNDPQKWNPSETLMLKKVGKPIAMYAKSVNLGMPVFDKPAGFDLMIGDWVAPYGKGVNTDIIFTAHLDQRTESDADYKLTVSFPKAGDGIQEFTVPDTEKGSGLRSPHEAPTDSYQSQWVQTRNRKPGQAETGNFDSGRNYFFRVRTKIDDQGNIVSAHYGKIYGDFMQFRYYLNPTLNSRNVEFDPKQNLLGGLESFQGVNTP